VSSSPPTTPGNRWWSKEWSNPFGGDKAIEGFTTWVNTKYRTDLAVDFFAENACFRLEPRWAFGLDDADFTGTPTRWAFGNGP